MPDFTLEGPLEVRGNSAPLGRRRILLRLRKPQGICFRNLSEPLNSFSPFLPGDDVLALAGTWTRVWKHFVLLWFYLNLCFIVSSARFAKFPNGYHKLYFQCSSLSLYF